MSKRKKEKKQPVHVPFHDPYEDSIFLDAESPCHSENVDIEKLDFEGLQELMVNLYTALDEWECIYDIDMDSYIHNGYRESDQDSLASDRRHLQTIKVELREVRRRIKMMNKNEGKELIAA